jgi:hypothetical protein
MKRTDQNKFEDWLLRQTRNQPEPEVSSEFLAAQRRSIYKRIESSPRRWFLRRWALSFAMLLLMVAGGVTLGLHYKTTPAAPPASSAQVSDDQLFSDLAAMDESSEPKAIQPMHGLFEE